MSDNLPLHSHLLPKPLFLSNRVQSFHKFVHVLYFMKPRFRVCQSCFVVRIY